jgi:hypothetical protein
MVDLMSAVWAKSESSKTLTQAEREDGCERLVTSIREHLAALRALITLTILALPELTTFGTAVVAGHGLRFLWSKPIMELRSAFRLTPRADLALAVGANYRRGLV